MANTILTSPGAKTLFNSMGPSGASPGIAGAVQFTPAGMLNGSGWKSDVYDLGPGPRSNLYEWRAKVTTDGSAPTVGGTLEIYFATSDDAHLWDGNLGSGNASLTTSETRRNLPYVGAVSVDRAASGQNVFASSGLCQAYARYLSVVWFDFTGTGLSATGSDQLFQLTPVPDQVEGF